MKHDNELDQLIRTLPPTQRTLDFDDVNPWQSLPESDRQACREVIAALLTHIAVETCSHPNADEQNIAATCIGEQT